MGWSVMHDPWYNKPRLVEYLISERRLGKRHVVLKHAVIGNHLWTVVERSSDGELPYRFIGLDLLMAGHDGSGWGYKDLCESMGLCELDCPVSFFDLVPEPPASESAKGWRDEVRKFHALKRRAKKAAVPGLTVMLGNHTYVLRTHLGRKGWLVEREFDGKQFRAPAAQVARALRKALEEQGIDEAPADSNSAAPQVQQMSLVA